MKAKLLTPLLIVLLAFSCTNDHKEALVKSTDEHADTIQTREPVTESAELKVHESKDRILPVDESSSDPSLKQFLTELKEIVRKKDLNAFTACLDTGIVVSHGGGIFGINEFMSGWKLHKHPEKSFLWPRMKFLLELGGAWENKEEFRVPYAQCNRFFSSIDQNDLDWYFTAVCIDPETIVYEKPDHTSSVTGILSYEIVRIINRTERFTEIQTLDKKISGFVKDQQIIVCAEAFPVFQKINGNWKITSFAPYD